MIISGLFTHGPPPLPKSLLYIKGVIILLSIAIFALAVYTISFENESMFYSAGAPAYLVFLAIATWVIYGVPIAIQFLAPHFYYRIVALIASTLSTIFWLVGWAWSTSWTTYVESYGTRSNRGSWTTFTNLMGACAGIGIFTWTLVVFELGYLCFCCMRYPGPGQARNTEFGRVQKHDLNQNLPNNSLQEGYTTQSTYGGQAQRVQP
ncbi:hypothetical protein F4820DRAFT_453590 [Hypoxylon rubiginosum]|uniref:Uncharacterized protein n=1 Tax=Hypoxylon rubiginosum TaxID=110542 RepID=A0ACB9YK93_9PEZI|nr:hypothetical protein F4820DRAFT_453590 [Hypoxylon rubiginosum]